ncbi:MAG: hypothetical protein HKN34_02995 [Gammaproteobacteria bacterium]|nr:hypothetical protein [Gammaproteobacteria bacterium]
MENNPSLSDKKLDSESSKSDKYWQGIRSDMNLLGRAKKLDYVESELIHQELRYILDSGILNYPQTLTEHGLSPDKSYEDKKYILGLENSGYSYNKYEKNFLEDMANKANESRKSDWAWRIAQEAEEKQREGWHPFFVTLTVDRLKADPEKLWKEGRAFRKYIRKLANVACKELKHDPVQKITKKFPNYRSESEYVTYCGVIEHGKSRLHHHGHFIIWLRAVPANWRACPNRGIRNPQYCTNNECIPMSRLWSWSSCDPETGESLSPALYFRSIGDVWENKYKFALPIKDGQPMKVSGPRTAGRYITKYLTKEFKEWHHRMKCTRNLGMLKLKNMLREMDPEIVKVLTWRAETSQLNHSLMLTHSLPLGLLRQQAKYRHYSNLYHSKQLDLKTLLTSNTGIFQRMLSSVRNGQRPYRMNSKDFYDWVGRFLPGQKGYCEHKLISAHEIVAKTFPHISGNLNQIKIGANKIGHSSSFSSRCEKTSRRKLQVHGTT